MNSTPSGVVAAGSAQFKVCPVVSEKTVEILNTELKELEQHGNESLQLIYFRPKVNDLTSINRYLTLLNQKLYKNGLLVCCGESFEQRSRRLKNRYGRLATLFYPLDFFWNRIAPKIKGLRKVYFAITRGQNRVLSRTEMIGRFYFCGFKLVQMEEVDHEWHLILKKITVPSSDPPPNTGFFYKKKSVGQHGRTIYVYKFRTMHPYAEYLRDFVLERNGYAKTGDGIGKIEADFRVTSWGRFLRKYWLDELPQIWNLLKRDIKIVGIRPLSKSFLAEYPRDFLEKRLHFKMGLLPPYAAHIHKSVAEYIESEQKYLASYEKHPFWTDLKYFFWITYNILTDKIRSQ